MKIHIISGFLGSGKTTFMNQYLPLLDGKVVVIENEFGDICLDTALVDYDVPVHEIYAGCICCTLAGNFQRGIKEIYDQHDPEHIVIEPSGVGKLSDVVNACYLAERIEKVPLAIERLIVLVDAESCIDFLEDFGEFYANQIENAKLILLSHLDAVSEQEKCHATGVLKKKNPGAIIYDHDWRLLDDRALSDLVALTEGYGKISFKKDSVSLPADKVFTASSVTIPEELSTEELLARLQRLKDKDLGYVLRAKGIALIKDGYVMIQYAHGKCSSELLSEPPRELFHNKMVIIGCDLSKDIEDRLFTE